MIHRPREIYMDNEVGRVTSLEIVDADGVRQIVKLKDQAASARLNQQETVALHGRPEKQLAYAGAIM
jgi:hypothetical protein